MTHPTDMERRAQKTGWWGMKEKIYSAELNTFPFAATDYMKIIAILYIYFPLVKSSPSVTVKVEVVCEVWPGRALRDKLRWYMTHGDSIKTLDLRHLEKWRSHMLGSCDIYKIKLFFLNIWSYISCSLSSVLLFLFSFPPTNVWILNNRSKVEGDRFSRDCDGAGCVCG